RLPSSAVLRRADFEARTAATGGLRIIQPWGPKRSFSSHGQARRSKLSAVLDRSSNVADVEGSAEDPIAGTIVVRTITRPESSVTLGPAKCSPAGPNLSTTARGWKS